LCDVCCNYQLDKEGGDNNVNERIKKLRKALDLTQQKFADRIGVKQNTVAQYEMGRNVPIDSVIALICREFNVSEKWLRTGEGDMFRPADRNTDIARLTKQLLNEESDSFKNRLISILSNLTVEEWEFLEDKARELCGLNEDID
jgi:transcriptional regulator with XRE-family HTH domain